MRDSLRLIWGVSNIIRTYCFHVSYALIFTLQCDLEGQGGRAVSKEEGQKCARKHQMMFIEASAKTREGVACAFEELVEKIIQTPQLWEKVPPGNNKGSGNTLSLNQAPAYSSSCAYCSVL